MWIPRYYIDIVKQNIIVDYIDVVMGEGFAGV